MESSNDVSILPVSFESERDDSVDHAAEHSGVEAHRASEDTERNERNRPMDAYLFAMRKQKYHQDLKLHNYNTILHRKKEITKYEARISQSKDANNRCLVRYDSASKRRLVYRLQQFEEGWAKIASVLRPESRKLFVLPRELRDLIYSYLYTRPTPVQLIAPYPDARGDVPPPLPTDPFFYLSASVVDPAIAAEAAQVLYSTNAFDITSVTGCFEDGVDYISVFLRTDHFGSSVVPRDIIRRLHLRCTLKELWPSPSHQYFEHKHRDAKGRNFAHTVRMRFGQVLEMESLRVVTIELGPVIPYAVDYREVSPVFEILKERGVAVEVSSSDSSRLGGSGSEDMALKGMLDEHYVFASGVAREEEGFGQCEGEH